MARLFEKNGYTSAEGIVLPLSDFRLFTDLPNSDTIEDRYKEGIIKRAEALIGKEYPVILATDYMAYTRTGDRTAYGSKTFPREEIWFLSLTPSWWRGREDLWTVS